MKKLEIPFARPQIEINGIVFDILKSDGEIFQDSMVIAEKYKDLDRNDVLACMEAAREMSKYVDRLLGKGALKKINGGREPGLLECITAMKMITLACSSSYVEKLGEYA